MENETMSPTLLCPHPEWWHATDVMASENEVCLFLEGFMRLIQPEFVLETGTYDGQSAFHMGKGLKENGHGELVTFEIDPSLVLKSIKLCEGLPVTCLLMNSLDYTPSRNIDFVFFDSDFSTRIAEFKKFYPFLTGYVAFHDVAYFGDNVDSLSHTLRESVLKLEKEKKLKPIFFNTPRGLVLAQVIH